MSSIWRVSVRACGNVEDAVIEILQRVLGQPAAAYTDARTGATSISVYLPQRPAWAATRRELGAELAKLRACGLADRRPQVRLSRLRRENWAESWKRHFKPLRPHPSLLVKPTWSRMAPKPGQAVVELDPGLSFGTGNHPTTGFCLRQIARARRSDRPQSLLDIGTGSGILAIAAAKLGFRPVAAFDYDPDSVRVARANLRLNGLRGSVQLTLGDVTRLPLRPRKSERYSVVCANLVSNLLIDQRDRICPRVAPGGLLLLAGILKSEFARVRAAYSGAGFRLVTSRAEKEWRSGAFAAPDRA